MTEAYIYDALRTPRGKGRKDGSLHEVPTPHLGAKVLEALRERNGLDTKNVGDVIFGCVDPVYEAGGDIKAATDLTNDLLNPSLWQFPSGTDLCGGCFLIVWADAETGEGLADLRDAVAIGIEQDHLQERVVARRGQIGQQDLSDTSKIIRVD